MKKRTLSADVLSEMYRTIGAMTGAGITMAKTMEILSSAEENKRIAGIYEALGNRIRKGFPIGDSMEELGVFPEMAVNMFRAAEVSGQMEKTANDLAEHYRKEHRIITRMKEATLYPKILCVMAISIVLFVFLVIMPIVEPMFYGVELPPLTRILMKISAFLKQDWHILVIIAAGIAFLEPVAYSFHSVRYVCDKVVLFIPMIRKHMSTIYTARFARNLSNLYASGVSMVESLEISSRTLGNRYLELQFRNVIQAIENGEALSHAVESVNGLDKKLPAVILVGEETGKLDRMLFSLADGYEHEAEVAANKIVSMMEPLMIVIIGVVVAVILLGIMIPMWSMYEYLG